MKLFLNISRSLRILIVMLGFIVLVAPNGFAQDIGVEVEVSSRKVALGSSIQFTITIHGDKNIPPVELPPIEGFDVKYVGPSTRVSIVNGQYSTSKSFTYSLFPLKVGKFKIPAFDVLVAGKVYSLQEVPVEIVGSMTQAQAAPSAPSGQLASIEEKLFITLKVPKQEVYLNEQLPVKIILFVSGLSVKDIRYPEINSVGISVGEYERPQQYQQMVRGARFDIVEFDTVVYPTREGELRLGPAKVECNILVKNSGRQSGPGYRNSAFDDDFFNSFFGRHEKRPVVLKSKVTNNA